MHGDIIHDMHEQIRALQEENARLRAQVRYLLIAADDAIDDFHTIQVSRNRRWAIQGRLNLENRLSDFNLRFDMAYEKFLKAKDAADQESPKS